MSYIQAMNGEPTGEQRIGTRTIREGRRAYASSDLDKREFNYKGDKRKQMPAGTVELIVNRPVQNGMYHSARTIDIASISGQFEGTI
jgi:hypothetical protein